jgi:hypothetical protein
MARACTTISYGIKMKWEKKTVKWWFLLADLGVA